MVDFRYSCSLSAGRAPGTEINGAGGHVIYKYLFNTEWAILLLKSELSPYLKVRGTYKKMALENLVPSDSVNAESLL